MIPGARRFCRHMRVRPELAAQKMSTKGNFPRGVTVHVFDPWGPMGPHGTNGVRVPMGTHGGPCGVPWRSMGSHGVPWGPTGPIWQMGSSSHGSPWVPMVPMGPHGFPWGPVGSHRVPVGPPWGPYQNISVVGCQAKILKQVQNRHGQGLFTVATNTTRFPCHPPSIRCLMSDGRCVLFLKTL